jgi:hypothetical protein
MSLAVLLPGYQMPGKGDFPSFFCFGILGIAFKIVFCLFMFHCSKGALIDILLLHREWSELIM